MTDRSRRRTASGLHLVGDEQPEEDALEALLLAQHGYQAAAEAADGATVPSLMDFVD